MLVPQFSCWSHSFHVSPTCFELGNFDIFMNRWWTDCTMIRELVACGRAEGNPLYQMIDVMAKDGAKDNSWKKLQVTETDLLEMEKFLSIMSPFEFLCSKMNSELESNIQRVYPTLKELLMLLGQIAETPLDTAHEFAKVIHMF